MAGEWQRVRSWFGDKGLLIDECTQTAGDMNKSSHKLQVKLPPEAEAFGLSLSSSSTFGKWAMAGSSRCTSSHA